jgi:PqqD family protein of HPr-rel-A system
MRGESRYCAAAAGDIVRVQLDELTAVFDRRSGQTHLLASPLPEMLQALGGGEWALHDFIIHLTDRFDMAGANDAAALIAERLAELAALGLVEAR